MSRSEGPLSGRVVLLTRPQGRGASLARALRDRGAVVDARPTIDLVPPRDPEPARRALARIDTFDWVLFTSGNGVRFFTELRDAGAEGAGELPRVAAVGPSTARALSEAGIDPAVVATDSRAEGLAASLAPLVRKGDRVLLVQPEVSRPLLVEALTAMGARPESIAFYRNVPAPDVEEVVRDLLCDRYDAVLLSSPSTLERLIEAADDRCALDRALERTRLVAIGPTTAAAVEQAGFRVAAVARKPTDEAVIECVLTLFP